MTEITRKTRLCSANGGTLDIVSADGEILAEIKVPAGAVLAGEYIDLLPLGAHLEIGGGLAAMNPGHRIGIQRHPEHSSCGANPDWRPTSASRFEREMRLMVAKVAARTERLEAREAQLAAIQRVPTAPETVETVEETPLVEDETPAGVES